MSIFSSTGLKRWIAAALGTLVEVVRGIPDLASVVPILEAFAASFGFVGVVHSELADAPPPPASKLLNIASILSVLVFLTHFVPALAPLYLILTKIQAVLSAGAIGKNLSGQTSKPQLSR